MPTLLDGLTVVEAAEEDIPGLSLQVDPERLKGRRVFIVRGANYAGYVVAEAVFWHEDEREYNDPSHFAQSLMESHVAQRESERRGSHKKRNQLLKH